MIANADQYQKLFDDQGRLLGVLLGPGLWARVEAEVERHVPRAAAAPSPGPEPDEPLGDWATLIQFWDFKYPVDFAVRCDLCGAQTADWREDEPRKFRMRTCSLGGLVRFECVSCKARISKRHFKDKITLEATPYQP